MNGPIRRLAMGVFGAMGALLLAVTWFQVVQADDLRNDPRNPRPALSERGKERGLVVTTDGTVVAESVQNGDQRGFERRYPMGDVFAHAVGYTSFLFGDSGLEAVYAEELRSRRDLTISDLLAAVLGRDLRPESIEITIDTALQLAAFEALGQNRGAVVALDPRTGAVLALASRPSFDPEALTTDDAAEYWESLLNDESRPLIDRATEELFPPGSTFKTVVTATAIDTGFAEPGTDFDDPTELELPGSTATISNFDARPCNDGTTAALLQAFVRSCNTIFGSLAMQLGAEEIGITSEALGFNQEIDFAWPIPEAAWPTENLVDDPAALAQSGIGERDVRATPLHMAMVAAAVANGGVTPEPYIVRRVFDADGQTVEETTPSEFGRAMAPETASLLAQMMERVVTEGTGRRAAVPEVRVAGKTGTATGPSGFPHSWFIGFAPVDAPSIAIAVLVEGSPEAGENASGGTVAAPIASDVIATWLTVQP